MAAEPTKRVLFLAYYFPPLGGGGVQRSLKFCKYLPQFGYTPRVVTGPPSASFYWPPHDKFINMGKEQGLKFTFGSDSRNMIAGKLVYCKAVARKCNLKREDFFIP